MRNLSTTPAILYSGVARGQQSKPEFQRGHPDKQVNSGGCVNETSSKLTPPTLGECHHSGLVEPAPRAMVRATYRRPHSELGIRSTRFGYREIKRGVRTWHHVTTAGGPIPGAPKMSGGRSPPQFCFSLSWPDSSCMAASTAAPTFSWLNAHRKRRVWRQPCGN
jgi:hypothetical protein